MSGRPRKPLTLFLFLLLVLGLLVAGLWQYHQMVVAIYDGASTSLYRRLLQPFRTLPDGIDQKPIRIAVLHRAPPSDPAGGLDAAEPPSLLWERQLTHLGFSYRRIDRLRSVADLADYNLLVLPSTVVISDAELAVIKQFLRRGHGLIMNWAVGTRDQQGLWRPSPLLRDIAGVELARASPTNGVADRINVTLDPASPLTLGIEPGFTLSLTRFDQPLSVWVREPRTQVAATLLDPSAAVERATVPGGRRRAPAVAVHGDYLEGRFVWLGYTMASSAPEPEQRQAFDHVLRNAIVWVTRQPIAYKAHWPEHVSSAVTLSWSLERSKDYNSRIPDLVAAYGIPLTTYLAPDVLDDLPADRLRSLAAAGALGVLIPVDTGGRLLPPPAREVLRSWRSRFEQLNRTPLVGCRLPPGAGSATDWLDALAVAGFDFVAAPETVHDLPRIVRTHRSIAVLVRAHELWMLPDRPVDPAAGRPEIGSRAGRLDRMFDAVHARGGLLHLSIPAQGMDDAAGDELDVFLARIHRYRTWIGSADQIVAYYRTWGHLRIDADYPTPSRYVVQVSNTGTRHAADVTIHIRLPAARETLSVTPTTLGTPPVHAVSDDQRHWRFDIPRIAAGKTFIYHLYR